MDNLNILKNQILPNSLPNNNLDPNEPVIVCALRTPITKARKGGLNQTSIEEILQQLLVNIIKKTNIPINDINDIIIGNALGVGANFLNARAGQFIAGIPSSIPLYTVNRLCNSGLQAIVNAHNEIKCGQSKVVIAGGIESMSLNNFNNMLNRNQLNKETIQIGGEEIEKLLMPMGLTNENICEKYKISRQEQDNFAYKSHMKAFKAQNENKFNNEICSIKTNNGLIVTKDDIIRGDTTIQSLSKLKPVFKKNGTSTAGNSSPLSDGGALCLLSTRQYANEHNLEVLGKIVDYAVVGVPSEIMGIGPSIAIPSVLKMSGLNTEDIDLFEINEAFAGQCLYCIKELNIPLNKVNIHGGAIALGHPLGCTGARLVVSMLNQLKMYNKKLGIVSMCIGTGMGGACIIERE